MNNYNFIVLSFFVIGLNAADQQRPASAPLQDSSVSAAALRTLSSPGQVSDSDLLEDSEVTLSVGKEGTLLMHFPAKKNSAGQLVAWTIVSEDDSNGPVTRLLSSRGSLVAGAAESQRPGDGNSDSSEEDQEDRLRLLESSEDEQDEEDKKQRAFGGDLIKTALAKPFGSNAS